MDVYIASAPENITPDTALRADSVLEDRWNGWLRPLATADAFGAFLDAWRRNDPNGIWGYATEVGDTLVCSVTDSDEPADEFRATGRQATGPRSTTSPGGSGSRRTTTTRHDVAMANQPKTRARAVRISDDVWDAAKSRADRDGVTTTDVVRRALVDYLGLPSETTGYAIDRQRTGLPSLDDA